MTARQSDDSLLSDTPTACRIYMLFPRTYTIFSRVIALFCQYCLSFRSIADHYDFYRSHDTMPASAVGILDFGVAYSP